ncbi:MAG: hypothetical protein IT210_23305 [Armatimonadetes bacterium]|nr:hypothetical protein [Armatimonadota bacterium]
MSAVLCTKCRQPVRNVPPWFGTTQAKFVCEECNRRNAVDVEAVLNAIRSSVQAEMARDSILINDLDGTLEDLGEGIESLPEESDDEAA